MSAIDEAPPGAHVAFEYAATPHTYLAAMDNGKFTLGPPRVSGE